MSKSGKLKKAANAQKIREKNKAKQNKKNHSVGIFVGIMAAVGIIVAVLVVWDKYHREAALIVDGDKIYKDEVMYYVYETEASASYMDSIYYQIYGTGYWETTDDSGMTNADSEKISIQAEAVKDLILEKEAGKNGITLTDEEIKTADENAQTIYDQIDSGERTNNGITLDRVKKLGKRIALGEKYKQHLIDGYDIDDEAIREGVDKDEYRQYNIQYYSVSYMETDDENNEKELSDEEIDELTKKLEDLKSRAQSGEDFETLIGEDEETDIEFSGEEAEKVWKADTDLSDTLTSVIYGMENEEISDVIKDEDSGELYLIKMLDNNSDEAYEDEVESQISDKEEEAFSDDYQNNIYPGYEIKIKDSVWDKINLGSTFTIGQ